ncbi:MocR-like pyridoxine biosynthesis transcription factor PdxR [Helicovermis profundi]|uniref:PLP-dependent aminotransferase family protein n=1 Tax=Helicovermis profundi TaxID=3065157 RepID=A0AAU9ELM6_9FIRM|nr:PLP-dependent aminotransferase family protein [Clostridia bacterium S502]
MDRIYDIHLKRDTKEHLYVQLYKIIKKQIVNGILKTDSKLPPIRKLANSLSVNNVTVVNAYKMLEENGYVYKIIGSGTFVNSLETEVFNNLVGNEFIDFSLTSIEPNLFPVDNFKDAINITLDRDKGKAFEYQEIKGFKPLRESLSKYLESSNIKASPENIHIISGAQQGIDIISKGLVDFGDTVIVENPTYAGALASFNMRGANVIKAPIEQGGVNIELVEKICKNHSPKFFYSIPNFQNPTGYSYSKNNKLRLLELAYKYKFYIIEDDYSSELNFNGDSNESLKSLDKQKKVIYIKSFSKVIMPGLRLGFIISPSILEKELLYAKHITDISTSGLLQRAFDVFLRNNSLENQLQIIVNTYKTKFDLVKNLLTKKYNNEMICNIPKGGLNFWLSLPSNLDSKELYKNLLKKGVVIAYGEEFFSYSDVNSFYRISIASVSESDIKIGFEIISNTIKEMLLNVNSKESINGYIPII